LQLNAYILELYIYLKLKITKKTAQTKVKKGMTLILTLPINKHTYRRYVFHHEICDAYIFYQFHKHM